MKTHMKRMASFLSFRDKVLIIAITCLILPAIITFTIYNYLTKDAVKEQANISAQNELKLTDEYLKKVFEDMLYTLNFIQLDTEFNAILKDSINNNMKHDVAADYEKFINDQKIQQTLDTITLKDQEVYITILLNHEKYYTNYSFREFNPLDIKKESWFIILNRLKGYRSIWIAPQPTMIVSERKNNSFQLSVARPLRDSNSGVYGYAMVTIMGNRINEILSSENADHNMLLLNEQNQLIAKNQPFHLNLSKQLNEIAENSSKDVMTIEGKEYLINTRELSITGWKLISLIPYDHAISKINSIFKRVFLFQSLFFIAFLLLLIYLLSRLLNRLVELRNVAKKVQKGDLSIRSIVKGHDEIATLSSSFNQMLDKVNEVIEENTLTQSRKREAELAMLQAQINPHFLFNVLNSIRMKVLLKRDPESAEMISSLSKLLRMTFDKHKEMITFQDELEINKDYIRIMNMRQRNQIELRMAVSVETYPIKVPRLILQPIIENAIIHGLSDREGFILIKGNYLNGVLMVEVDDNGAGMKMEQLSAIRETLNKSVPDTSTLSDSGKGFSSIGLTNVNERMKLTFGEAFTMHVDSELDKGTKVTMYIPIREE
ncbi:sensor histidine kinase [Neobacillus drentensis]|uniref:sensor histidine kinase n=1 Tax=Neobacillus drentensis TaxID=220684 RepID=UPI001F3E6080|nr:sensor histidine kinase [Neobacillus drentensis]ULT57622.1 sensor histidine kinase [Neobacillus drentensis]